MKRILHISLLILVSAIYSSCCGNPPPKEVEEYHRKLSMNIDEFIGLKLTEYIDSSPIEDNFSKLLYERIDYNLNKPFYAYSINVDTEALKNAKEKIVKEYNLVKDSAHKKGKQIEVFRNGKKRLIINNDTGVLFYKDEALAYQGYEKGFSFKLDSERTLDMSGVKPTRIIFSREPFAKAAQNVFDKYIPKRLFKNTYYYRFAGHLTSTATEEEEPTHIVDDLAIALNPTINKMPIVGSGGKYSVHMQADGTITSFRFQFADFSKKESVSGHLISKEEGMRRLHNMLSKDQRSLDNYTIDRAEFGYSFQSARGPCKTAIPILSYLLLPKEGVMDAPQLYQFPASNAPELVRLFEADQESERTRKAAKENLAKIVESKKG